MPGAGRRTEGANRRGSRERGLPNGRGRHVPARLLEEARAASLQLADHESVRRAVTSRLGVDPRADAPGENGGRLWGGGSCTRPRDEVVDGLVLGDLAERSPLGWCSGAQHG
eukprot:12798354-Alexandrium_andersonii.AAC.1